MLSFYSFLSRGSGEEGADLFYLGSSDRINSDVQRSSLCQGGFKGDIRRHFFTEGIVKHWKRFPRVVVDVPSQSNV